MRREAFESLYEMHAHNLYSFLAYRTGNRAVAEDLVADTFERAFKARNRFDQRRATEKTWLYAIALNLLRDHARSSRARSRALEKVAVTESVSPDDLGAAATRLDLMRAVERLSAEEREAVALRFGAQLTVPEIAAVTGQELTTAEGRVYRAIRKLGSELDAGNA